MEQTEMDALCEREKTVLSSSLEVLQTAEKEADEATEVVRFAVKLEMQ